MKNQKTSFVSFAKFSATFRTEPARTVSPVIVPVNQTLSDRERRAFVTSRTIENRRKFNAPRIVIG